jgi:hypothetical protein
MKFPQFLVVLSLWMLAPAMGANVTFERVTGTGESVPGREHLNVVFNGRTFQPSQNPGVFSRPSINEAGQVVFLGRSSAPHDFNLNAAIGIYGKSPASPLIVLADTTESSPGVPTFAVPDRPAGTRFTSFGQPMLNNAGQVIFRAGFSGTSGSGSGIYATTAAGGSIVKIVDTFDEVPGYPGTTFNSFFFSGFRPDEVYSLNDAGEVVFIGRFFRSGQSFEDNGLYGTTVAGGSLVPLVDTAGTTFGATETTPFRSLSQTAFPALNQQGTVLFQASVGSTPSVQNTGVFSMPVDGSALAETQARRPLLSPPLSDGAARNYYALWAGQDVNDSGDYLFQHTFFGSTDPPQGLFSGGVSGDPVSLVVDNLPGGFAVPGQPSGTNYTTIGAAAINNEGVFGFFARDNGPVSNAQGIYAADIFGSPFRLVAHLSSVPPGHSAPARFNDFEGRSASINNLSNMVIAPRAINASGGALHGLYFFDNCTSQLERIVDSTTSPPSPPVGLGDDFQTGEVGLFIYDGSEVRSGHFKSLNDSNQVAFMAAFETFNVGIYIAHVQPTGGGSQLGITCPPDVIVECGGDTGPGGVASAASAFNNCTGESVATTFSDAGASGGCGDTEVITRTWTADDGSGSPVSCDQTITVVDTTAPGIVCPPDATGLECPADTSVTAHGEATAVDNCGGVFIESSDVSVPGCGVTETITRTWTATDDCGLDATCDQVIATTDTTPPVVTVDTTPILAVDEDCSGDAVVLLPEASAHDDCDGVIAVFDDAPSDFPAGQTTTVNFSATDDCGNTGLASLDVAVAYGANIEVTAASHTVGSGSHPGAQKEPLVGIEICAYDKSDDSCARDVCGGISHHYYECIATTCPAAGCCTTDSNGQCTINVPPGDYVIISLDATKTVLPDPLGVSASDLACGETMKKHLQQIIRVDGRKIPGKTQRLTGSELLIIEPEFIVWDEVQQPYPFVFESVGEWGVSVSVTPPEGFEADYDELSTEVNNDLTSVQFTIVEVGSDLVPTQTRFQVRHNGRIRTVVSQVGITLTPDYAVSRGFDVSELRKKKLIVDQVNGDIGKDARKRAVGLRD